MRPRLRFQNVPRYIDRLRLDKDLIVLHRALQNKVPSWNPEDGDWQLPVIIEQYRHSNILPLMPAMASTQPTVSESVNNSSNQQAYSHLYNQLPNTFQK